MSHPGTAPTSPRPTPDLLLSFSTAVGIVLGTIVLLAATQTVVALIVAVAALIALLAAVAVLIGRVLADESDDVESPADHVPTEHAG